MTIYFPLFVHGAMLIEPSESRAQPAPALVTAAASSPAGRIAATSC